MIDTILNNRYRLDAIIGSGGMAVVYRGYDLLLRRQVAVKVLRPQHAADEEFVQRFYEEARAAAKLSHPNIVNTYDVGEVDGSHYIVEEFVAGETLAALIAREHTMPESVAVRYARQICLALGAAHRADLLHRDIKPSNVLITPDDVVRVTDFGIARAANAATLSGVEAIMGSIPYCSPEQLSGGPMSPASDLYSLGVVLYEMIVGSRPYVAETALGVAMGHVNSPIPDPLEHGAQIAPELRDVVVKLLQKSPGERYQSAGEALAALRRCSRQLEESDDAGSGSDTATAVLRRRSFASGPAKALPGIATAEPVWNTRRIVMLAGAGLAAIIVVSGLVASREAASRGLTLPDLSGKSQVEAIAVLHGVGIDSVVFRERADPAVAAGLVDGSEPAPNTSIKAGDPVVLYLSLGAAQLPVPNVKGLDPKAATALLQAAGFSVRPGVQVHSPSVRAGLVAQTNPIPGSPLEKGGVVALNISSGPETIRVPNIVSLSLDDAQAQLKKLGLKLAQNMVVSVDIPARTVIDQDPAGGSNVPPGATITADVSGGPNTITVPSIVGTTVQDAHARLLQAGLMLGTVSRAAVSDTSPDTVISQNPAEHTQAAQGTRVDIVVSEAPSSTQPRPQASAGGPSPQATALGPVPNVVGMSLQDAKTALEKAGYHVDQVTVSPGSPANARVVSSVPAPGATPPAGALGVSLVLGGH